MSLLEEIQASAASDGTSITALLRKCMVLAHRLGANELGEWARLELNGYGEHEIPSYRRVATSVVKGTLVDGLQMGRNLDIPIHDASPQVYALLRELRMSSGIAEIERLAGHDGPLSLGIPSPLLAALRHEVDQRIVSAVRLAAPGAFAQILDTVRTRVLDFTLKLESLAPAALHDDAGLQDADEGAVNRLFLTVVFGDQTVQNISRSTLGTATAGRHDSGGGGGSA